VKILLAGWFSFDDGHATAGDVLAREVVMRWLDARSWRYDVAAAEPFKGDVRWELVERDDYDAVLFVCGPFQRGELEERFLDHFGGAPLFGLNLSLPEELDSWNPFHRLWERDSSRTSRPDLVFLSDTPPVPVVGVCKVEPYPGGRTDLTDPAIDSLLDVRHAAVVTIDTRLDTNEVGLRTPAEVESLIARTDALVTTRLHGLVLALKNGVPVVAIDPEAGGAKLARQAETVGWPICFTADRLDSSALKDALDYCLTEGAQALARECADRARLLLGSLDADVRREIAAVE
jgi:Polysaccharide pyruvyl transferase